MTTLPLRCVEMIPMAWPYSGKLGIIGNDTPTRTLRVELEGGSCLAYHGVGAVLCAAFKQANALWCYCRDNIEEAFAMKLVSKQAQSRVQNPHR